VIPFSGPFRSSVNAVSLVPGLASMVPFQAFSRRFCRASASGNSPQTLNLVRAWGEGSAASSWARRRPLVRGVDAGTPALFGQPTPSPSVEFMFDFGPDLVVKTSVRHSPSSLRFKFHPAPAQRPQKSRIHSRQPDDPEKHSAFTLYRRTGAKTVQKRSGGQYGEALDEAPWGGALRWSSRAIIP